MKNITILLLIIFSVIGCEKENPSKTSEPITEIDKLPPATQTGANKIGCLLDGMAFKPSYYNNSTNCFYQYTNGGYYFAIGFNNKDTNFNLTSISLATRKKEIFQGETYQLYEAIDGNIYGCYIYNVADPVYTTHTHTGELKITKLDPVNYIVSGTFWFDVEDKSGVVHEIREGRFDMHYTN